MAGSRHEKQSNLHALKDTQSAYTLSSAIFIELPFFERYRGEYLSDEELRRLQLVLIRNPSAGDVIQGAGGLRKLRWKDMRRSKGTRGGLRIIYYWAAALSQFWLFTVYGKDEMQDLSPDQKQQLAQMLNRERDFRL